MTQQKTGMTEKEWADWLKKEQDIINGNFKRWKRKQDAKPKGKLVIRFGKYFDKDTRLVIDFLKVCLKVLQYASPLLVKFFPVAGPIKIVISAINALELLLKLKIRGKLKMDLKALDQDFADFVVLGCRLVNGIEGAMKDGEFNFLADVAEFSGAFRALGPAIAGASEAELPKSVEALDELNELVKLELDLENDKIEEKAEYILNFLLNLYKVLKK
jgi:hypothetical protein